MKNKILILLGFIAAFIIPAKGDQWRLHPTYSEYLGRIIDTPKYTYLLSGNQPYAYGIKDYGMRTNSLFRYDKTEKETEWLNISNKLSYPVVVSAEYNFEKSYLLVCYDNGDIDLIYDNGKTVNIPGLRVADPSILRTLNGITFIPGSNEAYIATAFGYITINDEKEEIGTSRIIDINYTAAVSYGGDIYVGNGEGLFCLDPRGGHDRRKIEGIGSVEKFLISGSRLYVLNGSGWSAKIDYLDADDIAGGFKPLMATYLLGLEPCKDGILAIGYSDMWKVDKEDEWTHYTLPIEAVWKKTYGYDGRKFWVDMGLKGVKQIEGQPDSQEWKATGETILPNAANCFKSNSMAYSDKYGMLVRNHGMDYNFSSVTNFPPDYISGLKGGDWIPYSISACDPERLDTYRVNNPNGLAIDPLDKDVVYCGSVQNGILRLNLADPSKSLRLGLKTDPAAGNPGFIGITDPPTKQYLETYSPFGPPGFDSEGYMWIPYFNIDANKEEIWYWSPEDRKATTSAANYKPLKRWEIDNIRGANALAFLPMRSAQNKNMMIISVIEGNVVKLIDHKGTVDNQRDDVVYTFSTNIYDQDGNKFDCTNYRTFFEDQQTGNLWVGTDKGVFYINPRTVNDGGDTKVTRMKIARNDGTSLADYLLDGACINMITSDGQGRKWFATNGGGITCTSPSGQQVLKTYTTENSMLPSDVVYSLCYNPSNNSMMISTDAGLAELLLSESSVEAGDDNGVAIYPNPVRPDYYGYVNIEGLEEGALVKITDSAGNLIKELGFADDGTIRWDVTNYNNKRVRSGVYYVLASGVSEGSGFSAAGKILVVN